MSRSPRLVSALLGPTVLAAMTAGLLATAIASAAPSAARAASDDPPTPEPPTVSAPLWRAYGDAIRDATVATPAEVVTDLLAPTPADPRTQWRTIDGEDYVLVANMRFAPFTGVNVGDRFSVPGDKWVAVPGEVKQACAVYRCRRMDDDALDLQLKQLLGLPPDAEYGTIMRYWVKPSDLFRPCTNPDIASTTCPEQVAVDSTGHPVVPTVGGTTTSEFLWKQANYAWRMPSRLRPATAVSCAKDWTTEDCYGFPWTRLGYTYDWTPGAPDDRGITEFVVAAGATAYMDWIGTQRDAYPRRPSRG